MAQTKSLKIADSLYLVLKTVSEAEAPAEPEPVPTNHVAVIDCSGSMYYDLPKIREQLKRKIPKILGDKDTLSVVWFSGRGEFGTLLEGEPVSTLADLKQVEKAVDRWLRPVGLTGFKEPMEEVADLAQRLAKKTPGSVFSLFFMSDGHDNCWNRSDILKAVAKAGLFMASSTFVEYGYYADRPLLAKMAETAGGSLIFSEDFDTYAPAFEAAMQKKVSGAPRIEVEVTGDVIGGFAFSVAGNDVLTFSVMGGATGIPDDLPRLWYLSPTPVGRLTAFGYKSYGVGVHQALYAAISLFAQRVRSDVVLPLLKFTGDARLIRQFSTCFGKQKYSAFVDDVLGAVLDPGKRQVEGYDPDLVPPDDAFTVLDLLSILAEDDGNRLLLDHSDFKYSRIGRKRVDSSTVLSDEEQAELEKLTARLGSTRSAPEIKKITAEIDALTAGKEALRLELDPAPDGYPISGLTFNEDRPNISVRVRKTGKIDLSSRLPDSLKGKVQSPFESFIFRNYAVVKDGLVNVSKLPVKVTDKTWDKLCGIASSYGGSLSSGGPRLIRESDVVVLNLMSMPVLNRKMVASVSAEDFFTTKFELLRAQAVQKVMKHFHKEMLPGKKTAGFAERFGPEGAEWLKEQGLTDYSGFSPKSVQAESTDYYMSKELKVSVKKHSSLPTVAKLEDMIKKGKLNGPGLLMQPALERVQEFLASDIYTKAAKKEAVLEAWLDGETEAAVRKARKLIYEVARTTLVLIVGQVWFSEFASLDENSMTLSLDGRDVEFQAEMREVQVRV